MDNHKLLSNADTTPISQVKTTWGKDFKAEACRFNDLCHLSN